MENIHKALHNLDAMIGEAPQPDVVPFDEFLRILTDQPGAIFRNAIQVFHDMILSFIGDGVDEYPDDPESINYVNYDCTPLFVEGADRPFFADRLFANRFINQVKSMRRSGTQQNKIYIFEGPPGCGKSTFLNNLLLKFESYANTEAGSRYEAVWRLDRKRLAPYMGKKAVPLLERVLKALDSTGDRPPGPTDEPFVVQVGDECIEVACPSHDNPILMIDKTHRRAFFDDLFKNDKFKWKLFTEKEFEWVFRDQPCTICSSLMQALREILGSNTEVFRLLHARRFRFSRRLGHGISVFNPGDRPASQTVLTNPELQRRLDELLGDSNRVRYIYSRFALTNNGIYALMDIKDHNVDRLVELHNIVSEGVHKVEDIEENVNSLFFALMNPEDKDGLDKRQSFMDRLEYFKILYVLDLKTEVEIYRSIFGRHITDSFLPRVLHNFARVIIASRLNPVSPALTEWIPNPKRYRVYCDDKLLLLKMEIYTGHIPPWLSEEDRKSFTAKRRLKILAESESEGDKGFSGRDSIRIFNEFFSTFAKENKLINMSMLISFFTKVRKDLEAELPAGFLDSLQRMYNYTVLQEVKESLYNYNHEQISRDVLNYLYAVNFDVGESQVCPHTGDRLQISEDYFRSLESRLLSGEAVPKARLAFRETTQRAYVESLTRDVRLEGLALTDTALFRDLYGRYVHNLKERALDPFLENENFRLAIRDYDSEAFRTYDSRIRQDVTGLIEGLCRRYHYTQQGAREICLYVVDQDVARSFHGGSANA